MFFSYKTVPRFYFFKKFLFIRYIYTKIISFFIILNDFYVQEIEILSMSMNWEKKKL
jgi:hypothetical protein